MGTDEVIDSGLSLDAKLSQNELDGSDESLNSVFEDSVRMQGTQYHMRPEGNLSGHGIQIFLNELPDPNDIHRSLSTSCIPVAVNTEQRKANVDEPTATTNYDVRNRSQFLYVPDNYEQVRVRSSSCSGQKDSLRPSRSASSSPQPPRTHMGSECNIPYIVMDCPCSANKICYRSSSSLRSPHAEYEDDRIYQRQVLAERDSLDSGVVNLASCEALNELVPNVHVLSVSAPPSRRSSFKKPKKSMSTSEVIEDNAPISHSSSTKSVDSAGTFGTLNREGFNDQNSMILQLVVPRSMTSNVNSTQMINSGQSPSSLDNVIIQNPNFIVSNDTNVARKMEGRSFRRLVDEPQSPPTRLSSTTSNSVIPEMEETKKRVFRKWLTVILSCVYATFVVMLGLVIYVADLMQVKARLAEVRRPELFNIFLTVLGILWLIFLHVDIRRFINSAKRKRKQTNATENEFNRNKTPNQLSQDLKEIPHHYCFMSGRHSGSFYLKIGAAGFCFGHLIHYGLLLSRQIVYFTADDVYREPCANHITMVLDIILPLFSFYQLFMIFKYSNVVIRRYCELSRFALMHVIAANICIWINTIIRETVESIQSKMDENATSNDSIIDLIPLDSKSTSTVSTIVTVDPTEYPLLGFLKYHDICISKTILSAFTLQASPYLYPFTIEYSLLVAGVWFIIWFNVDNTDNCCQRGQLKETCNMSQVDNEDFASNLVIHVDCHSANRGLFAGLFVLLATVISVIIFFVAMMNKEYIRTGMIINTTSDIILLLTMSLSVLFAYRQLVTLDVNYHAVTFLDDILLFIALPCFFLYAIFNVVAGMRELAPFSIVASVLSVVQVILQTPFIIDGLRRCSNTQALRYKKPGREILTFLVVCNLAMWILETFEIKSAEAHYDQSKYYGKFLWTILSHITLPLTLFYRFHSSVCLVDIWKSAYEAGD